ncbi:retrovirus-related pol polyprotein from transposon TNT 1-94 [Tanacetum coccineum]
MTHPHPKRSFVPQAVLTRSGKLSTASVAVNTVRSVNAANTKAINTARPVNIVASKQTMNYPRSITNAFKRGYLQSSRPFNRHFVNKNSIIKTNVNTVSIKHTTARDRAVVRKNKGKGANAVKASACWGNPQQKEYKEKGVIDSGCSRHMTGNKCYLDEYEDYDGGFVSFGDGKGRISGKGKIKTGSLDFDDVFFCKELKYNLFSVSQICDKKNNVLFTDTKCLVLSSNFKLLDESQVLLRVPRKDNIYSVDLKSVVPTRGVKREFSMARTPQQNGVAKRKNRTLIEAARTMLVDSKLPTTFWAEAVNTACYVLNRVLVIKPHNKTPYELICGIPPLIDFMKPFGCPVTILNTKDHLGRFDGKADEGYFIGYFAVSKAMRVFNKRTRIVEGTLNIRFLENIPNVKGNGPEWLFDIDSLTISMYYVPVVARNKTNGIARTKDNTVAGPKDRERDTGMKPTEVDENKASDTSGKDDEATRSESESLDQREMQTKNTNNTNGINTVTTPVSTVGPPVNTAKPSSSTTNAFEEHLFERFSHFKNAFSLPPVPNISLMDNTGIFGNAYDDEVEEEVDMNNVNSSYTVPDTSFTKFYKDHPEDQEPKKVLQALEDPSWVEAMQNELLQLKLLNVWTLVDLPRDKGQIDKTLFIRRHKDDILLVQVYVDDIIFGSTKKEMSIEFEKLMHDNKTASTLMETNKPLIKDEEAEDVDVHLYRSMIGSLMYLTASRPDIMFAVCACARFQVTLKISHLHVVKRIFRYLKGQPKLGLWYPRDSPFDLEAFSDSDYARASLDRKSTTRGCQFLGKRLISWQCKKQTIVANSTTKAEYVAAANCCGQVLWIQNQMLDYGYNLMNTNIYIDNESTICIVKNPVGDEAINKELGDRMERAATTTSSSEAEEDSGSGLRYQDTILGDVDAQTRFETTFKQSNDPPLSKVNTFRIGEDSMKILELMAIVTAQVKTVNEVRQLQALIDRKKVIITEASIRNDLHLDDAEVFINQQLGDMSHHKKTFVNPFHKKKIFANMKREGKDFSGRVTPLFDSMLVQASEEVGEDSIPLTDSTQIPIINQPSTSSQPKEKQKSRRKQRQEAKLLMMRQSRRKIYLHLLMIHYPVVLDLEKAKSDQAIEIASLKKRVDKLEKRRQLRTTGLKRFKKLGTTKRVQSSNASLGAQEDASKQGRNIVDINADAEVTLVNETQEQHNEDLMFDTRVLDDDEVFVDVITSEKDEQSTKLDDSTASEAVTTTSVEDNAAPTIQVSTADIGGVTVAKIDELTLAQTLIEIKAAKPKVVITTATTTTTTSPKARGVVVQEPSEFRTSSVAQPSMSKDKGKAIMIEPEVPLKIKEQVVHDKDLAREIQAKLDAELIEEEKLARQKKKKPT